MTAVGRRIRQAAGGVPEKMLGLGRFPAYHGPCPQLAGEVSARLPARPH